MTTNRFRRWSALVAAGALAVTGVPFDDEDALAKKTKSKLVATIDGKRYKSTKAGVRGIYASTSFSVNGASRNAAASSAASRSTADPST